MSLARRATRRLFTVRTKCPLALASETTLAEQPKPIPMRSAVSRSSGQCTSASAKAEPQAPSRAKGCRPLSAATVAAVRGFPLKVRPWVSITDSSFDSGPCLANALATSVQRRAFSANRQRESAPEAAH
eukprot:9488852-Pyramimonas_sp.AAC.1